MTAGWGRVTLHPDRPTAKHTEYTLRAWDTTMEITEIEQTARLSKEDSDGAWFAAETTLRATVSPDEDTQEAQVELYKRAKAAVDDAHLRHEMEIDGDVDGLDELDNDMEADMLADLGDGS